ncbi:hypothetical protein [Brevibacillus laterosporus]|uniref:Uncharacterized protein n=1 Tax=Brevibacillus laterosporus TaxID=1465 RepID=A0AAP3GCI6_BRELA|nr:hypothetical protein [Brevibacillus laterosporus]MCR8982621.1 hypothetical protein [Brevibacillus laterosporus]MCZ0809777.1 hypothetical protein [Brevibacillus laterosporus]MCZ0828389.1 hypothetical protein [Brevibacillus laterosporus]MCZ0852399.1 hypothetical protein [Brevibacillus laterosporus]
MKEMLDGLDEEELYHIVNGMLDQSTISLENGDPIDAKKKQIIAEKVLNIKLARQAEQIQRILTRREQREHRDC